MERNVGAIILLWVICLVVVLSLLGCSRKAPSENIAVGAKESISQVYETLPAECKTESTKKALEAARTRIDQVVASCELEKREIELRAQNRLIKSWLIGLVVAIIVLAGLRVRGVLRL